MSSRTTSLAAKIFGLLFTSIALLASAPALADVHPDFELGSGADFDLNSSNIQEFNLLLKVGFSLRDDDEVSLGKSLPPAQFVWAHVRAELSINRQYSGPGADDPRLPYLNIWFSPVELKDVKLYENGGQISGTLQALPTQIAREMRLDQSFRLAVSAIGFQFDTLNPLNKMAAFCAQVAVDALGYKMIDHASDVRTFQGVHVAGLSAEAGSVFAIDKDFSVRVVLGGSADLNFEGAFKSTSSVQSDLQAYLAVKANFTNFVTVFLKGIFNEAIETSPVSHQKSGQIMFGATFIF